MQCRMLCSVNLEKAQTLRGAVDEVCKGNVLGVAVA